MSAAAQSPIAISVVGLRPPWGELPMSREAPQRTDEELVEAVALADEDALGELYDRFAKVAYGLAYKILQDAALAEDAVQEAFLQIWRGAGTYRPERAKASTWLLTFVHRRAVDLVRREQKRRTLPVVGEVERGLQLLGVPGTDAGEVPSFEVLRDLDHARPKCYALSYPASASSTRKRWRPVNMRLLIVPSG